MNSDARGSATKRRTVLLVDDEKMVLDVGQAILQRLGHPVVTALSGEEAVDRFVEHRESIGCVVLDLTMPGMDGRETFMRLRELDPTIPIIIASGLAVDQVLGQFGERPPTAVIQKPYQIADLSDKIQLILQDS
jgi:CheY-like chemotaxis protein